MLPSQPAPRDGLTLVLAVDDLQLSAEARKRILGAAGKFIDEEMRPADQAAIVRVAGGTGVSQRLTSDKSRLHAALEPLSRPSARLSQPAGVAREGLLADTAIGVLRTVFDGLNRIPGPKAVVWFSENGQLFTSPRPAAAQLAARANLSSVVFYTLDPRTSTAAPEAAVQMQATVGLPGVARDTGGIFFDNTWDPAAVLERVLQDQQGCYRLSFLLDEPADSSLQGPLIDGITLRAKRPDLIVRTRREFPRGGQGPAPLPPDLPLPMLLPVQPFSSGDIRFRMAPLVSDSATSALEVLLAIEPKDMAFTAGPKGVYAGGLELAAAVYPASGGAGGVGTQDYEVHIPAERFQRDVFSEDVRATVRVPVRTPGPLEIHALVRDATTGKMGSAREFLDFPDFGSGQLLISGIFLSGAEGASAATSENPVTRIFKPGSGVSFAYAIFNARVDGQKQPHLETRVRVFRDGEEIYQGDVTTLKPDADPTRRVRAGTLNLHDDAVPGAYRLELVVMDSAADPARWATQSINFVVR